MPKPRTGVPLCKWRRREAGSPLGRDRDPRARRRTGCTLGRKRAACVVKTGKTPVPEGSQWRKLLASIPDMTLRDMRDRALIATLTYSFARIGAALNMKVEDLRPRGAGWTIRLHEKGGKEHNMPYRGSPLVEINTKLRRLVGPILRDAATGQPVEVGLDIDEPRAWAEYRRRHPDRRYAISKRRVGKAEMRCWDRQPIGRATWSWR